MSNRYGWGTYAYDPLPNKTPRPFTPACKPVSHPARRFRGPQRAAPDSVGNAEALLSAWQARRA